MALTRAALFLLEPFKVCTSAYTAFQRAPYIYDKMAAPYAISWPWRARVSVQIRGLSPHLVEASATTERHRMSHARIT